MQPTLGPSFMSNLTESVIPTLTKNLEQVSETNFANRGHTSNPSGAT